LMRVVRMHSIPAAWLLMDVSADDPAVVVNDWRVADDFVIHGVFGLGCFFPFWYMQIYIHIYICSKLFLIFFLRFYAVNALYEKIFL
jgi:hypothetical protein